MDRIQNENQWENGDVFGSDADMVPAEEPAADYEEHDKEPRAAGWRVLSVLFLLLGVGGLFLGLLYKVVSAFTPVLSFALLGYPEALAGSLAGYAAGYVKTLIDGGFSQILESGISGILITAVDLLLIAALVVTVLVTFISLIVSLVRKRSAKTAAFVSGVFVFLTYAGLFLWSYFRMSAQWSLLGLTAPTLDTCDLPTAAVAVVALFALSAGAIASDRRLIVNVIMLIVPLLAAFLMCYPGTETVMLIDILSFGNGMFVRIATLIFMAVIALNIVVSAIRIAMPKYYLVDCARFALMLVSAALMVIAFVVAGPNGRMALFQGTQLFCTIGLIALVLLGVVFAVAVTFLAKRAEKEYAAFEEEIGGASEESAEPAEEPAGPAAEAPAEAPAEGEEKTATAPAEESAEEPISEFERRMEALARGEQPEPAAAPQPAPQPQPSAYPPIAPRTSIPTQQRMTGFNNYPDINQYTYDPFINDLTPQQKNEFGDLFIACKTGKFEGLPIYVIGGNNEEFFRKVFIYLGKFRKDISAELLDKLYLYVSRNC